VLGQNNRPLLTVLQNCRAKFGVIMMSRRHVCATISSANILRSAQSFDEDAAATTTTYVGSAPMARGITPNGPAAIRTGGSGPSGFRNRAAVKSVVAERRRRFPKGPRHLRGEVHSRTVRLDSSSQPTPSATPPPVKPLMILTICYG
jgi:hypothetical protein